MLLNRFTNQESVMQKSFKTLLVACCFALTSLSVQALACEHHAEKSSDNATTQTAESETCACGKETCDDCASCEVCSGKQQKS